jgi:hypothetical protein
MRWHRVVGFVLLSGCLTIGDCDFPPAPDLSLPRCSSDTIDGRSCSPQGERCALDYYDHTCTCGYATWSCDYLPDLSSPEVGD